MTTYRQLWTTNNGEGHFVRQLPTSVCSAPARANWVSLRRVGSGAGRSKLRPPTSAVLLRSSFHTFFSIGARPTTRARSKWIRPT